MIAVWRTRDLRHIPLQVMSEQHIRNTIKCIERGDIHPGRIVQGMNTAMWKLIFRAELSRRARTPPQSPGTPGTSPGSSSPPS